MKQKTISFFIILTAMIVIACSGEQRGDITADLVNNPNTAEGVDGDQKVPILLFDEDLHDFGRLTAGENISYSFHFRNTGNADLIITDCSATCGCTVASFPKERVAPGADGYVTVSFNSRGKTGQQYQEVTVMSNAQPARTKLKITARVN